MPNPLTPSRVRLGVSLTTAATVLAIAAAVCGARTLNPNSNNALLVQRAISSDPATAKAAITALRAQGPAGLQALTDAYAAEIQKHVTVPDGGDASPRWLRIAAALEGVGRQKDAWAARLYWYTDWEAAKTAARVSGKPILSLRLLGNLDDELSCANSRFFRTALYPNAQVSAYLRTHYVLHWKSVRPAPTFTLDFGDGRRIVRTLTGNSIHYVLDSKGRIVDALPGLYGPQAFLRHLNEDEKVAHQSAAQPDATQQRGLIAAWHQKQFDELAAAFPQDCHKAFGSNRVTLVRLLEPMEKAPTQAAPSAVRAGTFAVSKGLYEGPVVSALSGGNEWALGLTPVEPMWAALGQVHAADARLDAPSRSVMASKHPDLSRVDELLTPVPAVGRFGVGGGFVGEGSKPLPSGIDNLPPMERLVRAFERSMAQDTARNEYVFHARLHRWFASGDAPADLEALNRRVYSDLFLTPGTDPWLGLAPTNAYTALPNDGLVGGGTEQPAARTAVAVKVP